jgi:phage terminase Nu1 subunit (DNA packaging protein)
MMIDMGRAREMYDDGLRSIGGGIWGKVPGLGAAIVKMNNFTFGEYIPKLKMKVGLAVLNRNMARYAGKLTEDQIAEITGRQMDAAFGGQNWRLLGANKNVLAITRLNIVAPDFLISRAKVIGQALKPYNAEQRYFLAAQAVGVYVLSRILNTIFSDDHDPHFEPKNWDSVVIGKRSYHARFIVSDAANLAKDLMGFGSFNQHGIPFITGRMGVLPKMAAEVGTGKDLFTGQNKDGLFDAENPLLKAFSIVLKDTAEWMTPMGVDGFMPGAAAKGQTGLGSAVVATVGVSSRKESPANEVWDAARDFNLNSKDKSVVNEQKRKDNEAGTPSQYRALNNLLDAGELDKAKAEIERLKNEGKTVKQIVTHYDRNTYFTGSAKRETAFFQSLTPAQQKQYQDAKAEHAARSQALSAALSK